MEKSKYYFFHMQYILKSSDKLQPVLVHSTGDGTQISSKKKMSHLTPTTQYQLYFNSSD